MLDQVALVNSHDEVIGVADKFEAHQRPAKLHRAISVWMVNENDELLIQQRSQQKIVGGGWWGNTVCGNVWPDESYEACALRRLNVELGITEATVSPAVKFEYQTSANQTYNEHEMDQLFVSRVKNDISIVMNPAEVSDLFWVPKVEFFVEVDKAFQKFVEQRGRSYPTAAETTQFSDEELQQYTPPLELLLTGRNIQVVPWTLVMAQFPEVQSL